MILAVRWAKEFELIDTQTKWYSERWKRGPILESSRQSLFGTLSITSEKRPHTEDQISPLKTRKEDDMALRYGMPPRG